MIDALVAAGWKETGPRHGGVTRECRWLVGDEALIVEHREGEWWIWIQTPHETRVLAWKPKRPDTAATALVQIQDDLTVDTYIEHLAELGTHGETSVVAHEQFIKVFENELSAPGDGMYFFFRDVIAHAASADARPVYEAALGDSEPPSAMTALQLALAGVEKRPEVKYTIESPPFPDQRAAKAKLDHTLWTHNGQTWSPALPEPARTTVDSLSAIAQTGFSLTDWVERAQQLRLPAEELLAAIAHASPPPPLFDVFDWVQRMQIAACAALAHIDDGWDDSQRKRLLFNVALGPVDWAVDAAVLVLAHVASRESRARADVESLFAYLVHQAGRPGFTCYAAPLATVWLGMDGLPEDQREQLAAWGREAWQGGPSQPHSADEKADVMRRRQAVMALDFASKEAANVMRGER